MVRREDSGILTIIIIAVLISTLFGSLTISKTIESQLQIGNIGMPANAVKMLRELLKP